MNVVYYNDKEKHIIHYLSTLLDDRISIDVISPDDKNKLIFNAEKYDCIIGARIPDKFFEKAKNLSYFIIPFAGIAPQDKDKLENISNVTVINSHFNAKFVGEHAVALLLASAKKLIPIHEKMKKGDWTPRYEHLLSKPVSESTLLILGYGHVGREVKNLARALNMKIEAIKRTPLEEHDLDFLGTNKDLLDALKRADYIIITLPLTEDTKGYLGHEEFKSMKDDVHIINVGRGQVINEEALYNSLKEGKIGGVAFDTWWIYPPDKKSRKNTYPSNYPLQIFDEVIFSPHRATHVEGREKKRMEDLANTLNNIIKGKEIEKVNVKKGY